MKFSVCLAEDAKRTAKQVLELLSSAYAANKEFVIVSHATDDFDSLASIKAVLFLLETIFGVGAKVFFDHPSEEAWIIRRDGGICDLRDYLEQVGRENVLFILVDANDINS
jgi:nanoRNase/pAp phosphatase (c-di-AMP/oligoRNAs hydrolase)